MTHIITSNGVRLNPVTSINSFGDKPVQVRTFEMECDASPEINVGTFLFSEDHEIIGKIESIEKIQEGRVRIVAGEYSSYDESK